MPRLFYRGNRRIFNHDASLGHYEQNSVLLVSSVFMVLSAINFGLHFLALQRRNIRVYSHDSETAFFITVIVSPA